ncbi:MAG: CinA family protein [Marmoricola sp.]|jgi:nicotinamide-nucleotide amidase|nr:CinA family protein [Marmoricola sp.]
MDPAAVHLALLARGETVACAESLTGGELAAMLSGTPGASATFLGGVVSYATAVKQSVLGVPAELVEKHGVVSGECAAAMADGVRSLLDADWAISTTGVAGPDSQEGKPVGTVFVGVAGPSGVQVTQLALHGTRSQIRHETCNRGLMALHEGLS